MSKTRFKILIVEDEMALNRSLASALSDNFEILSASTSTEGLRKAKKEKPNLILLDIMLPDKSGIEVLKELKADEKTDTIPTLVLTNLSDKNTISKILQAGGKDYLVKTDWSLADIVKKVKAVLK